MELTYIPQEETLSSGYIRRWGQGLQFDVMMRVGSLDWGWVPQTLPLSFRFSAELETLSRNHPWSGSSGPWSLPPGGEACFRSWVLDPGKLPGTSLWLLDGHLKDGAGSGLYVSFKYLEPAAHDPFFRRLVWSYQCEGNRMLREPQGGLLWWSWDSRVLRLAASPKWLL